LERIDSKGTDEFVRTPGFLDRTNHQSSSYDLDLQFGAGLDTKRVERFRRKRQR
jgi:hypothetical protein